MAASVGLNFTANGVVLGSANIANCSFDGSSANDAVAIAVGSSSQRPAVNAHVGMLRYNTDTGLYEGYYGNAWAAFASAAGGISVDANGAIILNPATLINFNNTATVRVAATANGTQGANIAFNANFGTYGNGTIVLVNANTNYNNTATINIAVVANGTSQANVSFNVNNAAVLAGIVSGNTSNINITYAANGNTVIDTLLTVPGDGNNYQADVLANGTVTVTNANLNFNNTASINVATSANGSTQANVAFNINTTMNLVSLNVSGNIANTGNLQVTQNIAGGNLTITQNATFGNVNTTNLNVSTISGTTNVDFLINGATQFRHRAGGFTYSGAGTAGNVGTTVLIEANGEPSFGFSRPNTAAGNVAGIGVFTFNSVDTDGIVQNYAKIEGIIGANTANSGNGRITLSTLTANTMRAVLTVNSVYVGIGTVNPSVNLHVAQNTQTGNLTVLQNTTTGNLVISTLANTVTLNVSANIANTGNLLVTQNTFTGNLSVTQNTSGGNASFANVNVSATINTAANLVAGNISTPQNTSTGNLSVTQNTSEGNLSVTQNTSTGNLSITQNTSGGNASFANVNVSATINTAANLVAGNISTPQNTSTGNLSVTQNATFGNITITSNVTLGNLVTANINGLNSNASLVGVMYISYMGVY